MIKGEIRGNKIKTNGKRENKIKKKN